MSCLLYARDKDRVSRIDLDELYSKEHRRNVKLISCFNKILNRIHNRIQIVAKTKYADKHIFYSVPEFILGEPHFDKAHCIAYLVTQLEANHFLVKYVHPNTLFVSWSHFIPSFVREQVKEQTGVVIDSKGNILSRPSPDSRSTSPSPEEAAAAMAPPSKASKYRPTDQYRPTGKFVYNTELFDQIERKVSFASPPSGNGR